ncbi:MAG: hypothetical protein IJ048_09340 [Clostridia bacterium]|nr:hypothetical protein [Clostridia bacterium]
MTCARCGRPISRDEAGLTRKLINRAAEDLYCFDCLGGLFHISRDKLQEMADAFRAAGCTLFL